MSWVAKPGSNPPLSNIPRKLTDEEVEFILKSIPSILGATRKASQEATENMKEKLKTQLYDLELDPTCIPDLIKEIEKSFHQSQIEPQNPVGIVAAEAIGQTVTQISMKSFHAAGAGRNIAGGIDAIKEMIDANQNRKYESSIIWFKDKDMSYLETLRTRSVLVGLTVKDIMLPGDNGFNIELVTSIEKFWWHDTFLAMKNKTLPPSNYVLRLYLDVNKMYQHRITMAKVAAIIEDEAPPHVIAVYGPASQGIIDLYPDPNIMIKTMTDQKMKNIIHYPELIFLSEVVIPALGRLELTVQGIVGIKSIYPVDYPVWNIVRRTQAIKDYPGYWYLILNDLQMRLTGIGPEKLETMLKVFDIPVVSRALDQPTKYIIVKSNITPDKIIREKILAEESEDVEYFNSIVQGDLENIRPPLDSVYLKASRVYFVEAHGTNLRMLLSEPIVDSQHTYCNNIHEMARVIGILSSKNIYIRELTTLIKNTDGYVNPRHIDIIASAMYCYGIPTGLNFAGLFKQSNDHMSMASFERSGLVFMKAAEAKQTALLLDTSSAISMGKRPALGSSGMDIEMTPIYKLIHKKALEKQRLDELDIANSLSGWLKKKEGDILNMTKEQFILKPILDVEEPIYRRMLKKLNINVKARVNTNYVYNDKPLRSEFLMKFFDTIVPIQGEIGLLHIEPLYSGLREPKLFQDLMEIFVSALDFLPSFTWIESDIVQPIIEQKVNYVYVDSKKPFTLPI